MGLKGGGDGREVASRRSCGARRAIADNRPMRFRSTLTLARVGLALAPLAFAACATSTESFPGKSRDQVWTAMVSAARSPTYSNWHVVENDVWPYEKDGRIEVWRLLRRYLDKQNQWPRLEDAEWQFAITLEDTDPPSVHFKIRSMCVPSHGWEQRDRYFEQVWELLGGKPPAEAAPTPASPPDEPAAPVDLPA